MDWTRRRFLLTAGLLPAAAAIAERATDGAPPNPTAVSAPGCSYDDPAYLTGDPYLAAAEEPGLGGRSFAEAREHAFRFRTTSAERDRHVLGVEIERA